MLVTPTASFTGLKNKLLHSSCGTYWQRVILLLATQTLTKLANYSINDYHLIIIIIINPPRNCGSRCHLPAPMNRKEYESWYPMFLCYGPHGELTLRAFTFESGPLPLSRKWGDAQVAVQSDRLLGASSTGLNLDSIHC